MYFKDNGKSCKSFYSGDGYDFFGYEFSDRQKWLELGQCLQRLFDLHAKIKELLKELESKHGKILIEEYDKGSGFTHGHAKPIIDLVDSQEKRLICRLIEKVLQQDLVTITKIEPKFKELRPYDNLLTNIEPYLDGSGLFHKELIEKYFDYITLDSLQYNLLEFWDLLRKQLDDRTNEINIPEPTLENRELYNYFLESRDNYVKVNLETALFNIRKGLEDILTRLWILSFDKFTLEDWNRKPDLDGLPGILRSKDLIDEVEFRRCMPLVKYGNSSSHIKGEVSLEDIKNNCKSMINDGINLINTLCKKYVNFMTQKNYSHIEFTKDGFSIGSGKLHEYIAKRKPGV